LGTIWMSPPKAVSKLGELCHLLTITIICCGLQPSANDRQVH
jgi:hypothetical protein